MDEQHVVTVFLERGGKILLGRRSDRVGTYRGRWAGVSGYLEPGETPRERAEREVREETGWEPERLEFVCAGEPLRVPDPALGRVWVVYPFRFRVPPEAEPPCRDWEHREFRWVEPAELERLETVPMLAETWARVSGGGEHG